MNEKQNDRLASFIRKEVGHFLEEEVEHAPGEFISIVYVEVVKRASRANVFVSIFPDASLGALAATLKKSENKASHYIRQRLRSKHAPLVRFHVVSQDFAKTFGE